MKKAYILRLYFVVSIVFSLESLAKNSFDGPYAGVGVQYTYNRTNFGKESYKGMSLSGRLFGGYGWVKERLYYGFEGGQALTHFQRKNQGLT